MNVNRTKFRETSSRIEIKHLIKDSLKSKENIIWQTRTNGRDVIPVKMLIMVLETHTLKIFCDLSKGNFSEDFPVYIKLNQHTTIFKGSILSMKKGEVVVSLPEKVTTEELRAVPRVSFQEHEGNNATFSVPSVQIKYAPLQLKIPLRDISSHGCGIILSDGQSSNLSIGTEIFLEKLGDLVLDKKIKGKIVFVVANKSKTHDQLSHTFKSGVHLEEEIPKSILDQFVEIAKKNINA